MSFSPLKENFVGREKLVPQEQAFSEFLRGDYSNIADLPRMCRPLAVLAKAVVRAGAKVFDAQGKHVGVVTSGTMVPHWKKTGEGITSLADGRADPPPDLPGDDRQRDSG